MIESNDFNLEEELELYNFELPEDLIAKYPVIPRDHAKLLVIKNNQFFDDFFYNLPQYLENDCLLVFNNTKVAHRRLYLNYKNKNFEVVFLERIENNIWKCLINKGRKIKIHDSLWIDDYFFRLEKRDKLFFYLSCWHKDQPFLKNYEEENFFSQYGNIPIPPYLKRVSEEIDRVYYQTIFAEKANSVAAPTAGLHFTEKLIERLKQKCKITYIHLSIGYGTFSPLTKENFIQNKLHKEYYTISRKTAEILNEYKNSIICVGTTTLRALEDNLRKFQNFKSGDFETELFIKPPDTIISAKGLITNFHLPGSSLLMLVSAFLDTNTIRNAYEHAIKKRYRFFSYGDGMLILRN